MSTFLLLYRKEMLCLFRDKEILIYGVLLPLLMVPTIALLVMEAGLCYAGMTQSVKTRIAIQGDAATKAYLSKRLENASNEIVDDKMPLESLRTGNLDLVVSVDDHEIRLYDAEARDPVGAVQSPVLNKLRDACDSSTSAKLKVNNRPGIKNLFKIETQVFPSKKTAQKQLDDVESLFTTVSTLLLAVLLLESLTTAIYAMSIPLVSEVEQKTLYTTLMIPGARIPIAASKYLAGFTASLASALQFAFSIIVAAVMIVVVITAQLESSGKQQKVSGPVEFTRTRASSAERLGVLRESARHSAFGKQGNKNLSPEKLLITVASNSWLFILGLGLACAVLFAVASWARSAGEAQLLLVIPSTFIGILPLFALAPDIEFNKIALAAPILNLFLVMKQTAPSAITILLVVGENLLLTACCVLISPYLTALRNDLGTTMRFRRVSGT